jgi:radical SAM superfamily enzyme YgiQ (UPF0313 family)
MRVLFVIQQLDFADHISIGYLSAIAKEQGWKTYFCSLRGNNLKRKVYSSRPEVIAYSANILGFKDLVEANKKIKKQYKFISIMGGPHPTFSPQTFEESGMDAYCIGEGEYAFKDFLNRINNNEAFDDIPNLITKNKINSVRPLITNLDELPISDRDLTLSHSYLKNTPKKTFYTTRGCFFECNYCCNNYYKQLYKGQNTFRRFSVERVIKEMEYINKNYKMDFVKIGDDLFAFKEDDWLKEFSDKYSKRIKKPFNCYLRFDRIDDKILKLLKKAGCYSVNLSVDSTSQYIREKILGRNMREVDILTELKRIKNFGINTFVNYMLAAPESKLEDDLATIRLSKKAKVTYVAYTTTEPMKGTKLYDYCLKNKYITEEFIGDMTKMFEKSPLSCFSEQEKNIRYNIFLLGCFVSKLPQPFYSLGIWLIRNIKPNKFFKKIRQCVYQYYIENKIFLFSKESRRIISEK